MVEPQLTLSKKGSLLGRKTTRKRRSNRKLKPLDTSIKTVNFDRKKIQRQRTLKNGLRKYFFDSLVTQIFVHYNLNLKFYLLIWQHVKKCAFV
jgi:hypothetical protein